MDVFQNAFRSEVVGQFHADGRITVLPQDTPEQVSSTGFHESTHRAICEASTLGNVFIICGAVSLYEPNSPFVTACESFARSFVKASLWVHEGGATAAEYVWIPVTNLSCDTLESTRPRFYIRSAQPLAMLALKTSEKTVERFAITDPKARLLIAISVVQIAAACAMSPPLGEDFVGHVFEGRRSAYRGALRGIRERYRRIQRMDPEVVADAVAQEMGASDSLWGEGGPMAESAASIVRTKNALRDGIASACGIEIAKPDLDQLWESAFTRVPGLAEHAKIHNTPDRSSEELETLGMLMIGADVPPERVQSFRPSTYAEIVAGADIRIVEVAVNEDEAGTFPGLLVHRFDEKGTYLDTAVVPCPPRDKIGAVLAHYPSEGTWGIVVGRETRREHLGDLLDGVSLVEVPLFNYGLGTVDRVEPVGGDESCELQKLHLSSGEPAWRVCARIAPEPKPLDPIGRAYLWVVRSGAAAWVRWLNYHPESLAEKG
ncbi:MAG: hypothetical protein R3344_02540 [Acidobacteriota bacterium]|nr:hypothetical protein [Acidobacteriota bacterium]